LNAGSGGSEVDKQAVKLAREMIESGEAPLPNINDKSALALAWALKDQCYSAWSSEPQRAAKAADALRNLLTITWEIKNASHREIEAVANWTGGIGHITRGEMAEATKCLDRAAEIFRGLGLANHATQTQVPKIMALSMLGEFDAAIECAEQAQREFVTQGDATGAGKVSLNLGALHVQRGAYAQAARYSREASVLFARVGDHERSVQADVNMADALASMGNFDEALRIYARARMRSTTHAIPVQEARIEESVALLELARGRYREALSGFERARRSYERLAMPYNIAITEKQLADTYLELRLLPEALTLFDQVLTRFETLNIPVERAWTLSQRGRVYAGMDEWGLAADSFERAAELFAAQGNRDGEAAVTLARAELALLAGDATNADLLSERAAQSFDSAGLAEGRLRADVVKAQALLKTGRLEQAQTLFSTTLDSARELQLVTVQVRCHSGQGLVALALGDSAVAYTSFSAAIALFEDQRRALPGHDLRRAFLTDHLLPYQELLRMSLQQHTQAPSTKLAAEVLQQLDRFRARSLGERLAETTASDGAGSTQDVRDRLNWLHRRVQRLDEDGESSKVLTDELRRTESDLLERARRARLTAPISDIDAFASEHLAVEALQVMLGASGALVEYGVLDDELFACVITDDGLQVHRHVAQWSAVLSAVRAVRFQLDTLRHGIAPVMQHMASLTQRVQVRLAQLHTLVWAPLANALAGRGHVLVVPHAQLGLIPFAALHDGGHFLAQHHQLAIVPSARLALRGLARRAGPIQRALVLGESSRLPYAANEAHLVAGFFPEGQAFVDEQATIATLLANAGNADVIHLACHGQFRSDNPMFSALHLHDGPLTVELAESLSLKSGMVVLSACETGLATLGTGDEMVGLVRAFLIAGTARVLASLWPVDDAITAEFMASFYSALCRGDSPAIALQRAQDAVRLKHPHPFYWAAFTLHGGW
jgi:CHAT domain-containing protein/tetratricopeptide (TPR) repeat protein